MSHHEKIQPVLFEQISLQNAEEVVEFFHRQFGSLGKEPNRRLRWCDLEELNERLSVRGDIDQEAVGFISRDGSRVVGAALAYRNPFSHDEWTIPVVAIEKGNEVEGVPSYRGRGIGKELIQQTFTEVKKLGGKAIVADTNKRHDRGGSPEFLQACGFQLIGEIERYFDGNPSEIGLMYVYHP